MKKGTVIYSTEAIPDRLQKKLRNVFPNTELSDLVIRYYDSVEDVGYEYFVDKVTPSCIHSPTIQYLEPFISFTRLGEALTLASPETVIVFDTDHDDACTETGPFWLVTPKSQQLP